MSRVSDVKDILLLGGVGAGALLIYKNKDKIGGFFNGIGSGINDLANSLKGGGETVYNVVNNTYNTIAEGAGKAGETIKEIYDSTDILRPDRINSGDVIKDVISSTSYVTPGNYGADLVAQAVTTEEGKQVIDTINKSQTPINYGVSLFTDFLSDVLSPKSTDDTPIEEKEMTEPKTWTYQDQQMKEIGSAVAQLPKLSESVTPVTSSGSSSGSSSAITAVKDSLLKQLEKYRIKFGEDSSAYKQLEQTINLKF